jgi:hypothetical protein
MNPACVLIATLLFAACGSHPASDPNGLPPHVFDACSSVATPALPPSTSAAGGTFSPSPALDAVMCPGAAVALILANTPRLMSAIDGPYFFLLGSQEPAGGGPPPLTGIIVNAPSGTVSIDLDAEIVLSAPTPGTYTGGCGYVSTDILYGSGPTHDGWLAATGTGCGEAWWTPRGTWTLRIDSVTEQDLSPDQPAYVPHGTFTATMPEYFCSEPPPVTVSFVF